MRDKSGRRIRVIDKQKSMISDKDKNIKGSIIRYFAKKKNNRYDAQLEKKKTKS